MRDVARELHDAGRKVPGFGHPVHRPVDPRAERILELADERGVSGRHVALARAFRDAVAETWGKPLPMNVAMPIAAVMLDLGFPADVVKAVPILARTAGLLAHLAEEREQPLGFLLAARRRRPSSTSDPRSGGRDEAVGGAARARRRELPRPARLPPRALAVLSREARGPDARRPRRDRPAAAHRQAGAEGDVHAGDPIGAHLCVPPSEIVRIYSTSGTTGTPSYVPLTAGDLDNWVTGSARSYAASGVAAGQRIVSTYNAGPFVAGAALDAFERIGLTHVPVGTGNTERLLRAIELLRPEAGRADALVRRVPRREPRPRGSSVERVLVAGEPGGGEPAFRATLEEGWGAKVTEAMGIGDIGVSLWGECEEQDGMHLGARGFVHAELIEPETGDAVELEDGATGELVLTHLRHRAAPLLRFRTRDHVRVWTSPCACGRTSPRVRCLGRTDDMLIVRGVNVFPSAIREVVAASPQAVAATSSSGRGRGEAGAAAAGARRARARRERTIRCSRNQSVKDCAPCSSSRRAWSSSRGGACERSEYKSKLVERQSEGGGPMATNTLNILKPSVNNLTVRMFVRAAGLDFEEQDVWGKTTTPGVPGEVPGAPDADARGGRAAARLAGGELRDHGLPLQQARPDQFYPDEPGERAMVDNAMFYLIGTFYPLVTRATYPTLGSRSTRARSRPPTPTTR